MIKKNVKDEQKNVDAAEQGSAKETELLAKIAELTGDLQRTRADFENYRKQTEVSMARAASSAEEKTVMKVLTLVDDMYRAIAASPEVLAPVEKTLSKCMGELGLKKIEVAGAFDPEKFEAVSVSGEGENEEMTELRPGYEYNGRVVRPAMVNIIRS